jgi:hypothetical protein
VERHGVEHRAAPDHTSTPDVAYGPGETIPPLVLTFKVRASNGLPLLWQLPLCSGSGVKMGLLKSTRATVTHHRASSVSMACIFPRQRNAAHRAIGLSDPRYRQSQLMSSITNSAARSHPSRSTPCRILWSSRATECVLDRGLKMISYT